VTQVDPALEQQVFHVPQRQRKPYIVAEAIRQAVVSDTQVGISHEPEVAEAEEGQVLTSLHRRRERSRELVGATKREALRERGTLACEVCDFDFGLKVAIVNQIRVESTSPLERGQLLRG
jgi:predicted HNH restriction endonuclease